MATSRNEHKNANWMCASLTLVEQPAGQCPIASGETGPWNDAGTLKWRHADGSDTTAASADALEGAYRCHAVCTSALAIGAGPFVYANGTLGVGATLTGDANGAFPTTDGVAAALNNVYLVTAQAAPAQNGYYKLTTLGTAGTKCVLTRMEPLDQSAEWKDGVSFVIRSGTVNADTLWRYTAADSPTMGTTSLTIVRDPLVVTTNTAQTITGAKTHSAAIYPDAGIDRSGAAALAIGATNANAVNVGSASVPISALGGVTITTTKKLLAGANELAGTVADKLNPVHIAHAAQATGDLLYADSATTMTRLADVAAGSVLASGGVGVAPAYSATPTVTSLTGSISVLTPNVDAAAATTLALGAATATKVEIADTTVTTEVQGPLTALEGLTVTGNASVSGNLRVTGATVSTSSEAVRIGDNYLDMNDGYTTAVAQPGGLVVNYLPTATVDTVAAGGFTAANPGVADATIATTGAATFALADIIQISGASNQANNGLFEVFSHAANVLTLRGVGLNACVEGFTLNQVVTSAGATGAITKVTVSVIRAGADGEWETGKGAVTPIVYADVAEAGAATVASGTGAITGASASDGTGAVTGSSASATASNTIAGSTAADGTGAVTGSTAADGTGATGGTTATNVAEARSGFVRYEAPIAAELVSIVADVAMVNGAQILAGQPDYPRKLQIRITDANSSVSAGTIDLVGVGASGEAVTESVALTGGTATKPSVYAYATVTSATIVGLVGVGAGDNVGVGVGAALALVGCKTPASSAFAVHKANVNNANEAIGAVDATAGTISPTSAPNAVLNFSFWYTFAVTSTQNSHTHTGPSHTHAAGTLAGPSHTHAAGTLAGTDAGHTHAAGTLAGPSHTHAAGTLAGPSHTHTQS